VINFKRIISVFLISILFVFESNAVIKDSLFITVGSKAITRSDIVNEIKIILITNAKVFSEEQRKQLETVAMQSVIKRAIKNTELEKFNFLTYDRNDLDRELIRISKNINMDPMMLKNTFEANDVDFSILIKQIETELLWNSLIFQLYKNKLEINADEIEEELATLQKKKIREYLVSEIVIKLVDNNQIKTEVENLKNKIKNEGFENVAMKYSISDTAIKGGDLGWVNENSVNEKLKLKLTETPIGEISDPMLLPDGILMFKIRDKREMKEFKNLEEAKNQIVKDEKKKILKMHSLSHYDKVRRKLAINYFR